MERIPGILKGDVRDIAFIAKLAGPSKMVHREIKHKDYTWTAQEFVNWILRNFISIKGRGSTGPFTVQGDVRVRERIQSVFSETGISKVFDMLRKRWREKSRDCYARLKEKDYSSVEEYLR